jgi:hypothetical protein
MGPIFCLILPGLYPAFCSQPPLVPIVQKYSEYKEVNDNKKSGITRREFHKNDEEEKKISQSSLRQR